MSRDLRVAVIDKNPLRAAIIEDGPSNLRPAATPIALDGPAFLPNDIASYLLALTAKLVDGCVAQYTRSACNISAN